MHSKKENLFEFSLIGNKNHNENINSMIEDLFENTPFIFRYDISTYKLQFRSDGVTSSLNNTIEIYQNINDDYEKYKKKFL